MLRYGRSFKRILVEHVTWLDSHGVGWSFISMRVFNTVVHHFLIICSSVKGIINRTVLKIKNNCFVFFHVTLSTEECKNVKNHIIFGSIYSRAFSWATVMLSWNDEEVRLFLWYILWLVSVRFIKVIAMKAVEGYGIHTWTSCLDAEKLLLILPTSPMLKVDESTG